MNKLKALIIDDEEAARNVLEQLIYRNCSDIEVVGKCTDVLSAVESINSLQPDVLFLDVQMPVYAGYEIVDFIDDLTFEIIFVTAYDKYAIKAFELNAIDYLVKPINRSRLIEAVEKLKDKVLSVKAMEEYRLLKQVMKTKEPRQIVIPELGQKRMINLEDIIAIEAKGAYSTLYLVEKQEILVSKNLKYFETALPEDYLFFRSHKSWIINTKRIIIYKKSSGEIELYGNITARISKYRTSDFEQISR